MTEARRIVRPKPARTEPIRSGGFFGSAPAPEGSGDPSGGGPRTTPADPLSRAVETGYQVVESYIRQSERIARGMSGGPAAADPLGGNLQDLATRWFQYTSEMTELWLQLVGLAASGDALRNPAAAGPDPPPPPPRAAPEPARVGITVISGRPVEVTVEVRPPRPGAALRVHELRDVDPDKPRIDDVTLVRSPDDALALTIRVADDQPSGTYSGVVLDEQTSLPVGTVAVRVP